MKNRIGIVDYGLCNLLNVYNAFIHLGGDATIINNSKTIKDFTHIILPGVGAFKDGMKGLNDRKLIDPIKDHINQNKPFLGICLGMQMMLDKSYEFGEVNGLGLIKGKVIKIPNKNPNGNKHKIPHIGWNEINYKRDSSFKVSNKLPMYFVHSYMVQCSNEDNVIASCDYNQIEIESIIKNGNSFGCQFHPEKSGNSGLAILDKFMKL